MAANVNPKPITYTSIERAEAVTKVLEIVYVAIHAGEANEAIKIIELIKPLLPVSEWPIVSHAHALIVTKRHKPALELLNEHRYKEFTDRSVRFDTYHALALHHCGNTAEAERVLNNALKRFPDDSEEINEMMGGIGLGRNSNAGLPPGMMGIRL